MTVLDASEIRGFVVGPDELDGDLIEGWTSFCRSSPVYRSPFYSPHFTRAIGRARSDTRIAIYEAKGEVVAVLPFHRTRGGAGKPIGGQLNDYQGPIMAPGIQISPQALLLGAGLSSYDFNHLPVELRSLSGSAHRFSRSPQMDLARGYDALIARKGKGLRKARSDIVRCRRKAEREIGPTRFAFASRDQRAFARLLDFKESSLGRLGVNVGIRGGWIRRALEVLRSTDEPGFSAVLSTLHAGDRFMAAHFGLRAGNTLHWWFPTYDPAVRNFGPGLGLIDACATDALANGIDLIDFGRGSGGYKDKFADTQTKLCEGTISRVGSVAHLARVGARSAVSLAERLPLGRYETVPRRLAARLVSGVSLSSEVAPASYRKPA